MSETQNKQEFASYHLQIPSALLKRFNSRVIKERGTTKARNKVIIGLIKDYLKTPSATAATKKAPATPAKLPSQ